MNKRTSLKIAIVWEQRSWGGVDSYLQYLLNNWPEPDDEIVVFYNLNNEGALRLIKNLPHLSYVKFISFKSPFIKDDNPKNSFFLTRALRHAFIPIFLNVLTGRFIRLLESEGFDVLLAQNGGYPAAWGTLSAIFAARKVEIPVRTLVVHHRASKPGVFHNSFRGILDRMISKAVTSIIAISFATKETIDANTFLLEDEVRIHVRVIHNGVPLIKAEEKNSELRSRLVPGNSEDDLLIGIVGRIESYKGHEDLIAAFSRLPDEIQLKIRIVIIGQGSEEETTRLKKFSKKVKNGERIHFGGYIPGSSQQIIGELDLLVMATRSFEGFGLTIAEAMSVKVPVIATKVGAVSEFVNEDMVELIEPGAIDQLALAIERFVKEPALWKNRAIVAHEHIENFSAEKMAYEYREHLMQKISSS